MTDYKFGRLTARLTRVIGGSARGFLPWMLDVEGLAAAVTVPVVEVNLGGRADGLAGLAAGTGSGGCFHQS